MGFITRGFSMSRKLTSGPKARLKTVAKKLIKGKSSAGDKMYNPASVDRKSDRDTDGR